MTDDNPKPKRFGFTMESARKGGIAAHAKGRAHEWTTEEAREAGRLGGIAAHKRRRERLAEDDRRRFDTVPDLATMAAAKGDGE